jgi:hypothetical protein
MTPPATFRLPPRAVKVLFVAIGLFAVLIGLGWFGYSALLVARSRSAEGVVVGHETEDSSTRTTGYPYSPGLQAPVIAFKTAEGRAVQFTSSEYVAGSRYPLGRAVRVLYDRAKPERAEIDSRETLWLVGAVWVVGGLACVAGGFGIARLMDRGRGHSGRGSP